MTHMDTPRTIVEEFFSRMENGNRETITDLFHADAVITLPGAQFSGPTAPEEFLAHLEPRYEWAAKEYDRWIETDETVVSIGRLYGIDIEGAEFGDVRYVDVYEVTDGKISQLDIYNDLAVDGVV